MDAIVFDFDDTLVADQDAAKRAFRQTAEIAADRYDLDAEQLARMASEEARRIWRTFTPVRSYCLNVGISSWEGLWADFDGDDPNLRWLRERKEGYRRQPWEHALGEEGIKDSSLAEALGQAFVENREAIVEVYADVVEGLEALRQQYRLALLTNGASDLQRRKIAASGLARYFDVTVVSGDLGEGKPAPSVFETTLDQLGVPAARATMVGDSIERDVGGAQALGMIGGWINRDHVTNATEIRPDRTIFSLAEL